MHAVRARRPFHYAWVILIACSLLSAASTGALSYFGALFVEPVTSSLGISRAEFTLYTSFATVTSMCVMPVLGDLYRRVSPKLVIVAGALCGFASMALFATAVDVAQFYFGAILSGVCISFCGGMPIAILLNNWFERRLGLATGIAFTGPGLVSSALSPVVASVVSSFGWRAGYVLLGALVLLGILPATFFLIRMTPAEMGLEPYGHGENSVVADDGARGSEGMTRGQALRQPSFWLFLLASFLVGALTFGSQQHLVAYWGDSCGDVGASAAAYSVVMLVAAVGKVLLGSLFDRFSVKTVSLISGLAVLCAMVALVVFTIPPTMYLAAVLVGLIIPLQVMVPTNLTGRLFGQKDYAALYGLSSSALFLGAGVGAPLNAVLYDVTAGYIASWILFGLISVVLTLSLMCSSELSTKSRALGE